jgi:hypothetical protein
MILYMAQKKSRTTMNVVRRTEIGRGGGRV